MERTARHKIAKIGKPLLVVCLATGGLGPFALDWYGRAQLPAGQHDAIVVLGARVWPGGVPSKALKRRTRRAVELWKAGYAPRVVFTGGVGAHPPSEAHAAATYALELGLPETSIELEDHSRNTIENARFTRALIGPARVLVVTDAYHALRSGLIFRRFFPAVHLVGIPLGRLPPYQESLREIVALAGYAAASPFLPEH